MPCIRDVSGLAMSKQNNTEMRQERQQERMAGRKLDEKYLAMESISYLKYQEAFLQPVTRSYSHRPQQRMLM